MSTMLEMMEESLDALRSQVDQLRSEINQKDLELSRLRDVVNGKEVVRCAHCGTPMEKLFCHPEMSLDDFVMALRGRSKIKAIKYLRASTKWGLKNSKDVIDALIDFFERFDTFPLDI